MMNTTNKETKARIGVFDSGYGGLTILKAIADHLPQYDYLYLGDNARAPYGSHSFDLVYKYTLEAVTYLFNEGCELVVLACNTASAKALRTIQQNDLAKFGEGKRVLGVIRPSIEQVGDLTQSKHVGLMATRGTVLSNSYEMELYKLYGEGEIKLSQLACPMLVPIVENNEIDSLGAEFFVKRYIDELLQMDRKIDSVILACTHYPLLKDVIRRYLPRQIEIIEQGAIVAKSLEDYLSRHQELADKLSTNGTISYLTTESNELFDEMGSLFMEQEINSKSVKL